MEDHSLNITKAAQLLGVDPGTLRRWVSQKALPSVKTTSHEPMRFRRNAVEAFARKAGISLNRDRRHPDHFTPPTLAAAINAGVDENTTSGVTATTIRRMIADGEITILKVPCSPKRVTLMVDQAEGLRVIALFARTRQKAG